jgi:hypothetical protein
VNSIDWHTVSSSSSYTQLLYITNRGHRLGRCETSTSRNQKKLKNSENLSLGQIATNATTGEVRKSTSGVNWDDNLRKLLTQTRALLREQVQLLELTNCVVVFEFELDSLRFESAHYKHIFVLKKKSTSKNIWTATEIKKYHRFSKYLVKADYYRSQFGCTLSGRSK